MATNNWMMTVGLSFGGALGCASMPLPYTEVSHYEASIEIAKRVGAFQLQADKDHRGALGMSPAKEHLVLADDQFELAKIMAVSGDPRALLFLERAQSDVDLALGLAREAVARPHTSAMNEGPWPSFK
jgi:hypothetical protein